MFRNSLDPNKCTKHTTSDTCVSVCVTSFLNGLGDRVMVNVSFLVLLQVMLVSQKIVEAQDEGSFKPANEISAIESFFIKRIVYQLFALNCLLLKCLCSFQPNFRTVFKLAFFANVGLHRG